MFFLLACMEYSASETLENRQKLNPSGVVGDEVEDLLLSCISCELRDDGSSGQESNPSESKIAQEEEEKYKKIKNQRLEAQETSDKTQWFSKMSAADHDRIWGFRFFMTFEDSSAPSVHNGGQKITLMGSQEYKGWDLDSSAPERLSFAVGSSSGQSTMKSSRDCPSISSFVKSNRNTPVLKNGLYSGYATNNDLRRTSRCLLNQKGGKASAQVDALMYFLFYKLDDAREEGQLNLVIRKILLERELFVNAAFCREGASSIINLIQKSKKSSFHAFALTRILATRFWDIMTHRTARTVIKECLILFGRKVTKILYEKAILHYKELAIHQVGCLSLNNCIKYIAGEERKRLLDRIANVSDYLSNDPYGNYVVQEVLSLGDINVTYKILCRLQSQFVQLAQKQGGSHVVEECMESSTIGLISVVQEILMRPRTPFLLAKDQFGNYVIQTALKKTKELGFGYLYNSLSKSYEPYYKKLNRTKGGRNVLRLLRR